MKESAKIYNDKDGLNHPNILIQDLANKEVAARDHLQRIRDIDRLNPPKPLKKPDKTKELLEGNNILARAERERINNMDAAKEMELLLRNAKVMAIRDRQLEEGKIMEDMYRNKESKLDFMMELERLKELKFLEDREQELKRQRKAGGLIIIDQIKEKEIKRMHEQELIKREGELMKRQIKVLQEEDQRREENKRLEQARMAKEIERINVISTLSREKKKLEEKEIDLKNLKFNMEKAKQEEEALREKQRIQKEREMETQKLREKQERATDKQAALDELRAKRAFEEAEKKAREKEEEEKLKLIRQRDEIIAENEKAKLWKQEKIKEQATQEKKEFDFIIRKQQEENEAERRENERRKKNCYANGDEVRRQILEKEEKKKLRVKETAEEGQKIQEELSEYKKIMEMLKREKLKQMEKYNIEKKYRKNLENYKIV